MKISLNKWQMNLRIYPPINFLLSLLTFLSRNLFCSIAAVKVVLYLRILSTDRHVFKKYAALYFRTKQHHLNLGYDV